MDDIRGIEDQKEIIEENDDPFKISFYFNEKNVIYGFLAEGETGSDESGEDIVSAGISALVINTINSLRLLTNESVEYEIKRNFAKCNISRIRANKGSKEGVVLLRSLRLGMNSIQENYGDKYVIIKEIKDEKKKGIFYLLK
jgi:uncharacterized protein YsxB (DUF464 family)